MENLELDIVTGFRVTDPDIHLVVLEGLRDGAAKDIAQHVCKDVSSGLSFKSVCAGIRRIVCTLR